MKSILLKTLTDRRRWVFSGTLGLIFSTLTSWGRALDKKGSVDFFGQLPEILLLTPVFTVGISLVWILLERIDRAEGQETGIVARKKWLIPVMLLLCWLPAFLAE